jgi:hypothetical protein
MTPFGWVPEDNSLPYVGEGDSFSDPNLPVEYSFGSTGVGREATPEQLAEFRRRAYVTPEGADMSYYYIPESGPVMTGYTPEQRELIESAQRDARTRGIGTVAALVGGAAALGATPWGSQTPGALSQGTGSATVSGSDLAFGATAPESGGALAAETLGPITLPESVAPAYLPESLVYGPPSTLANAGVGAGPLSRFGQGVKNSFSNYLRNPDGSINIQNALTLGGGALGALGILRGPGDAYSGAPPPGHRAADMTPGRLLQMDRTVTPMAADKYATYGQTGGEHRFFTDPTYTDLGNMQPGGRPPAGQNMPLPGTAQRGALVPDELVHMADPRLGRLVRAGGGSVSGPGTGRSDSIEALLSDGEYVMDAESVALLGDGSTEEGSRRLDEMRENLRKHKGRALARGQFTPSAHSPEKYMGLQEGGNVQLGVTDLPPVNSNQPAPLPNARGEYADERRLEAMAQSMRAAHADLVKRLASGRLTERESEVLRERLKRGYAKGGKIPTVIPGSKGQKLPDDIRRARLESMRRIAESLRQKKSPPKYADGGEVDVMGAKTRLADIRKMAETTPISKDPVKALVDYADRLADSAQKNDADIADIMKGVDNLVPEIRSHFAKGGRIVDPNAALVDQILSRHGIGIQNRGPSHATSTADNIRRLAEELRRLHPESPVLKQYDATQKGRE